MTQRRVVFAVYDGFQALDLFGPFETLTGVNRLRGETQYELAIASMGGVAVRTESGIQVHATAALDRLRGEFDTFVCVGGAGVHRAVRDERMVQAVARLSDRSRRVASVCTGAFLLAAGGVLDGRRAVTHWAACDELARSYPRIRVERDPLYVRDGDVWTSAGVTAGIDLALALVVDDTNDASLAQEIARWMVVFSHRPGGQTQFSESLGTPTPTNSHVRRVVTELPSMLREDCSVGALAAVASMSERHFARRFRAETGRSPAEYVEALRVEAAKTRLSSSADSLGAVARDCGFTRVETLHRAFRRRVGTTPDQYRSHFRI